MTPDPARRDSMRQADASAPRTDTAADWPRRSFSVTTLLLPALLILAGLALLGVGQARSRANETAEPASAVHSGWAEALMADVPTSPATEATPVEVVAPLALQPAPEIQPDGYESYCLWPNDTLGLLAANAKVSEQTILAANPGWTGQAGRAIRLPPGSVPPSQWAAPLPPVARVEDLPFGISGYYLGRDNRQKRVALSFDVGYAEGNQDLKEMLAARGIRATFFVLGGALVRHPYIIGQILDNGHELGNHSYTHDNMLYMSESVIRWELALTEQLTQEAYPGATTRPLLRAPFGAINGTVVRVANSEGFHAVGWTVDSRDWDDGVTADAIYERVVTQACPGAIIAFHDANPANTVALPRLLDFFERNGYQFVTVSQILSP
ncbi:MAG: polysaccharide deacetylase family protein [Anaerolineae bacterium]